ncbi:MAG TPA: AzlD domain-containing protein [Chloroflexota bacterium]|jgi:branched-subunit amino acid transport protein
MTLGDFAAIVITSLAVFTPKVLPLVLVGDRLAPPVRRWLEFVAPAVLAALVAPSIFTADRAIAPPRWELLAFGVTFVVAVITRRMLPPVAAGLAVLLAVVVLRG